MRDRSDPRTDEHRRSMRARLQAAFEAELAARETGGTARAAGLARSVADDCAAIMASHSDPSRLVALTLFTAKAAIPRLDVHQIQGGEVDVRSRGTDTVVPLVAAIAEQQNVAYRPSVTPFVSNPYREPRIDAAWVRRRRGAVGAVGQRLLNVLNFLQANPGAADDVLAELVAAQVDRFELERVAYQVPSRVTVAIVVDALEEFLATVAGGTRLERVAVALLRFAGEKSGYWDEVIGHHGNDAAGRDADCLRGGEIVALGESKDQDVTAGHVRQLAEEMREAGAGRGLLFTRDAHVVANSDAIAALIERRHLLGQRIEVLDMLSTARAWLILADATDADLPRFLEIICEELDEWADLPARRDWAQTLDNIGGAG
jgi:hypothetical protein